MYAAASGSIICTHVLCSLLQLVFLCDGCVVAESALFRILLSAGNKLNPFTQSSHVEVQERATFAQVCM